MARRDGRFWGWISGNPSVNHLWREDPDVSPPRLNARCGRSPAEVGGVHAPLYLNTDGRPPTHDRCHDCDVVDRVARGEKRARR
jgi:hypothetical protein